MKAPAIEMMMPASDQIEPRRAQIGARLAWGLCVVCLTLVALTLVYGAWTHSLRATLALEAPNAIWAVSFPVVGALIATHRPEVPPLSRRLPELVHWTRSKEEARRWQHHASTHRS
jgi:hypothetical protein